MIRQPALFHAILHARTQKGVVIIRCSWKKFCPVFLDFCINRLGMGNIYQQIVRAVVVRALCFFIRRSLRSRHPLPFSLTTLLLASVVNKRESCFAMPSQSSELEGRLSTISLHKAMSCSTLGQRNGAIGATQLVSNNKK